MALFRNLSVCCCLLLLLQGQHSAANPAAVSIFLLHLPVPFFTALFIGQLSDSFVRNI